MDLADVMSVVLVDQAAQLRARFPDLYAQVDAIKARTGWTGTDYRSSLPGRVDRWEWHECGWCGDDFVPDRKGVECCGYACATRLRAWKRRRAA